MILPKGQHSTACPLHSTVVHSTYCLLVLRVDKGAITLFCPYKHKTNCESVKEIMPLCFYLHCRCTCWTQSPSCLHVLIDLLPNLRPSETHSLMLDPSVGFLCWGFDIAVKDLEHDSYQLIVIAKGESGEVRNFIILMSQQITPQVL